MENEDIISEYVSDDGRLKAVVVNIGSSEREWGTDAVRFYRDGKHVATEYYPEHSLQYYENAAENYVLGIKVLD